MRGKKTTMMKLKNAHKEIIVTKLLCNEGIQLLVASERALTPKQVRC